MKFEYSSIHGRFQPFHLGHFEYLRGALSISERVYIGLARVLTEVGTVSDSAPHRLSDAANPMNYFERVSHIKSVIVHGGIDPARVDIGPFPIENPERLHEFWPTHLPCVTTRVSAWNDEKIRLLKDLGYMVEVIKLPQPEIYRAGKEIRRMIRGGDLEWRNFMAATNDSHNYEDLEAIIRKG